MSGMTRRYVLSAVETDSRIDPTVIHVARQIAPGVHTAMHYELFPFGVNPHALKVRIVLDQTRTSESGRTRALAKHVVRGCDALFDGVLPVLYPNVATEDRVVVIRDVTGGVNTANVRLAILVDDNAIVHVDATASEDLQRRFDADADDGEIAVEP